jgi:hypothetical protein
MADNKEPPHQRHNAEKPEEKFYGAHAQALASIVIRP